MELLDYLAWRWRWFAALLLVGLVLIGVVGAGVGSGVYEAKSQLLVRPPVSQASLYGGANLDRYINSEMAQLYTRDALAESVDGTEVAVSELARSLTWDHPVNSDLVELSVVSSDPGTSVDLVNAVGERYLESSAGLSAGPAQEQAERLDRETREARASLRRASNEIVAATNAYLRSNPDQGAPPPASVAPAAASTQILAQQKLQRLDQEQAALEVASPGDNGSRVLRPAAEAEAPQGWGPSEYAGAVVGLLLALLSLAGLALALSKRLFGTSRWEQATQQLALARAVRYRGRKPRARERDVRRIASGLSTVGDRDHETAAVFLPRLTASAERRSSALMSDLAEAGWFVGPPTELEAAMSRRDRDPESGAPFAQALLVVDLETCEMEDVLALKNLPVSVQQRIVPVLV